MGGVGWAGEMRAGWEELERLAARGGKRRGVMEWTRMGVWLDRQS